MSSQLSLLLKSGSEWLKFTDPIIIFAAHHLNQISDQLKQLEQYTKEGKYVAGFISYEAASAMDTALNTRELTDFPLMLFGVFNKPVKQKLLLETNEKYSIGAWQPSQSPELYNSNIARIKENIKAGDTYQVNYTMRLTTKFKGSPYALFYQLAQNQKTDYTAFIDFDNYAICSVSPELFFSLDKDQLIARPMKGTAARGGSFEQDILQQKKLKISPKEKAENLMIVDMIRNDFGKICNAGSVGVPRLFNTERYPTVWQMTSDVQGRSSLGLNDIFKALFPCASITGAPKPKTMQIIKELEKTPRKIYTGTIGYFSPEQKAQFNVAIRTVLIDRNKNQAEYGVGSGIVWDSVDNKEYEECILKAKVLTEKKVKFDLLETMLVTGEHEIFLLDYHMRRLRNSAEYFDYFFDEITIRRRLLETISFDKLPYKLRLLLAEDGSFKIEHHPVEIKRTGFLKISLAKNSVDSSDPFLYHKTTNRMIYENAMEQMVSENVDDVLLKNEKGEITESPIANVILEKKGQFYTPPIECGLLNGTFRQSLIANKKVQEKVILREDIANSDGLFLVNSVKKWQRAKLFTKINH